MWILRELHLSTCRHVPHDAYQLLDYVFHRPLSAPSALRPPNANGKPLLFFLSFVLPVLNRRSKDLHFSNAHPHLSTHSSKKGSKKGKFGRGKSSAPCSHVASPSPSTRCSVNRLNEDDPLSRPHSTVTSGDEDGPGRSSSVHSPYLLSPPSTPKRASLGEF